MFPQEVIDRTAYYLPYETAIELSPYLKSKLDIKRNTILTTLWREYAKSGNLFGIKWLHYHEVSGCTEYVMDLASYSGHLEVMILLHQNRQEGCTKYAMTGAAMNGHLEVVKWLHENRQEVSLKDSLEYAARVGQLEVAKWIVEHLNPEDVEVALTALEGADYAGQRDIVDFLQGTINSRSNS